MHDVVAVTIFHRRKNLPELLPCFTFTQVPVGGQMICKTKKDVQNLEAPGGSFLQYSMCCTCFLTADNTKPGFVARTYITQD